MTGWDKTTPAMSKVSEAIAKRDLTLLVGAGVSKDNPANVPLYHELARDIYSEEWESAPQEQKEKPGLFFDEIKKKDCQLH